MDTIAFNELITHLGSYRIKRDEHIFSKCPFCGNSKNNFEINVHKGVFSCWACGQGGHVSFLYKKYGIENAEKFVSTPMQQSVRNKKELPTDLRIALPAICGDDRPFRYLKSRGLTEEEIVKYRILWWEYEGRVVFPFYDIVGSMIFWTARSIFKGVVRKYIHKECEKDKLCMRWPGIGDIILVEGVFDGLVANRAGYDTVVLMGTSVGSGVVDYLKSVDKKVIVCLDKDALNKQQGVVKALQKILSCDRVGSITPSGKDLGSQNNMVGMSGFAGNIQALLGK